VTGKAERRAQRARIKRTRGKFWWGHRLTGNVERGKVVDTPTPCSCWMCGNARRRLGEQTIYERRWFQSADDDE
jgi:hypothetical protein